nr:MAG TPA: PilX N-terminal [Caudoviricetes sp.]
MVRSTALFGTALLTVLFLVSLLFPFVSSLFTPTLSERRSKTKTVYKKNFE